MNVSFDFSDRTVVVSGAANGIGAATASAFGTAGANVVAVDIDGAGNETTAKTIRAAGGTAVAYEVDVTDPDAVTALIESTIEEYGAVDVVANVAGINPTADVLTQPLSEIREIIDVNLLGTFVLARTAGQAMCEQRREGRIVNVSSVAADIGLSRMAAYASAKNGVEALTRALAARFAGEGVTVNAVSPGVVATDRVRSLVESEGDELYELDRIPLGRLAHPEEIAVTILFLASDGAGYVTGADLPVDGGVSFTRGHIT